MSETATTGTDAPDATTAAYSEREQAIVAAVTRLRPQGPDAASTARAKDRLMLLLTAEPAAGPTPSSAIAS